VQAGGSGGGASRFGGLDAEALPCGQFLPDTLHHDAVAGADVQEGAGIAKPAASPEISDAAAKQALLG
jgi:hypothetical protein